MRICSGWRSGVLAMALLALAGCRTRKDEGDAAALAAANEPRMEARTRAFFEGVLAAPGSPERKRAGEILDSVLKTAFAAAPGLRPNGEAERRDRFLTHRILGMTVEYMKSDGARCAPEERIRLFRGHGKEPLVRAPGAAQGFTTIGPLSGALLQGLVKAGTFANTQSAVRFVDGLDSGELVGKRLGAIDTVQIDRLDWRFLLGEGRASASEDQRPELQGVINQRWFALAGNHSGSASQSPLISTTLMRRAALTFSRVGLVLDVCPERVMPAVTTSFLPELEVYVPLVIFPEEIVAYRDRECTFDPALADTRACDRPALLAAHGADEQNLSPMTHALRSIFLNFDEPLDGAFIFENNVQSAADWPAPLLERFHRLKDVWYRHVSETRDIAGFRASVPALQKELAPDCAYAQTIMDFVASPDGRFLREARRELPGSFAHLQSGPCPALTLPELQTPPQPVGN